MKTNACAARLTEYFGSCLYFSAGRLYRRIERMAFEVFKPLGLAPTHAFLLMALHELKNGQGTPSDLSDSMSLDRSTITRLLAFLEKNKFVKLTTDGRKKRVSLTAKGHGMIPEIRQAWTKLATAYKSELGEKNAEALNANLRRHMSAASVRKTGV